MWLGQVHCAGPFRADQFWQIHRLLIIGAVRQERFDRAKAQHGAKREGHIRAVEHFHDREPKHFWEPLPAPLFGR